MKDGNEEIAPFEMVASCSSALKLDLNVQEFAYVAQMHNFSEESIIAVADTFQYLRDRQRQTTIRTLLKMSRLPMKDAKTFKNFDFTRIYGQDVDRLKSLPTLSPIYAHKNIAFIGPPGTGKTHLAQAFGYECCQQGLKTYFIKMSELRDKFNVARKAGREASVLNGLVRPSCLIIDEVGHCEFDKENTRLFFDLIDRRYNKEGAFNIVFTSNKNPSEWRSIFNESDALLCTLDRIFDDAIVYTIKGASYRGRKLEKVALTTTAIPAPTATDTTGKA